MPKNAAALTLIFLITADAWCDDWPQWRGLNRDGVWHEDGIVEKFESEQIPIKWRVPTSSGYSGPTIADGRVYVTDFVVEPEQTERVHCFDAGTGQSIWSHSYQRNYRNVGYQAGPRAAVTIVDGRAFSFGTMGDLYCFDAASGDVLWKRDLDADYQIRMPNWGMASAPLVDGDLVIIQVGGAGACLVAFDVKSGEERWKALYDKASYAAPIMIEQAGQRVMVAWTGGHVAGLNPQTGEVHWKHPLEPLRMVIATATPVVEGNRLFVSSFYDGSLMLRLSSDELAVSPVWRRRGESERITDALHSMISTPYLQGNSVFGVDSYGEFRCLDADTGDRLWESQDPVPKARWATVHMVKNGERIWMFNERGELIISRLSREGFDEISRAKLLSPTLDQLRRRDGVCWAHPAYANRHVFARNDKELVCASLAEK